MADLLIRGASKYDDIIVSHGKAFDAISGEDYELVVLPKHERLIDADELMKDLEHRWNINYECDFSNKEVWDALESAPTVIEASKEE